MAAGLCGLSFAGCGGDNSTPLPKADATSDAVSDVVAPSETGADVDAASVDAADGGDAADSGVFTADGGEGGIGLAYAQAQAAAQCVAFLNCCTGGLDGGTYNLDGCIQNTTVFGWEGTLPGDLAVYSRGNVTLDQSQAASCIAAIKTFPCGTQTAAQAQAITSACEGVMQGKIPVGTGGCISSFECAPNGFCDPTVDGGLCTALATQGQACNTKINSDVNPIPDEMCSYLGSSTPALFCDLISAGPDAATCQPLLAAGANCVNATTGYYDDMACVPPAQCGDNSQCGGTASYPYPNFCTFYTITDAGGGG